MMATVRCFWQRSGRSKSCRERGGGAMLSGKPPPTQAMRFRVDDIEAETERVEREVGAELLSTKRVPDADKYEVRFSDEPAERNFLGARRASDTIAAAPPVPACRPRRGI
jgi:hypothetical protein